MRYISVCTSVLVTLVSCQPAQSGGTSAAVRRDTAPARPPLVCGLQSLPAITVHVRDSASGGAVGQPTVLVVRDGAYVDSTDSRSGLNDPTTLFAAWDRPGTYRVAVRAPGYVPWVRDHVKVPQGQCRAEGVRLEVALRRHD